MDFDRKDILLISEKIVFYEKQRFKQPQLEVCGRSMRCPFAKHGSKPRKSILARKTPPEPPFSFSFFFFFFASDLMQGAVKTVQKTRAEMKLAARVFSATI